MSQVSFENRTVIVTGAGGSIGSEMWRQIVRLKPNKLLLLKALRQLDGSFKLKILIWKKNK